VPEDEAAVRARLAALDKVVRAETAAKQARSQELPARPPPPRPSKVVLPSPATDQDEAEDPGHFATALQLASQARGVKAELTRPRGKGEKSWARSAGLSLFLGPVGWLYAGSLREAIPASLAYVAFAAVATKILPMMLLLPVLVIALPASAIAGFLYALRYNRSGKRTRLFKRDRKKLASG
jgi:hypothetical protein